MSVLTAFLSFIFNLITRGGPQKRRPVDEEFEPQRAEEYPPPYPNGWFNICPAHELKPGDIREVKAFGQKLVVYRGENGKVGVLDAFCPHLRANLSDGRVEGDKLVCPFHGWQFNNKGRCTHIPYSENDPPPNARTRAWHVRENWGLILVWYHADGEAPEWHTDSYLPEIEAYKYHGYTHDTLYIHLQDFAENGADYAHFNFVHNLLTIPFSDKFVHLKHDVEIHFGEGVESFLAWFSATAKLTWNKSGKTIEKAGGHAKVTYYGPGFLAFEFNSRLAKDVVLLKTFTPIGPLKLRMEDHAFAPKGTNRFALKYILREAAAQFHDDIVLWERKGYAERPMLVKGDGPILRMRKWYSQFYTDEAAIEAAESAEAVSA